LPKSQPESNADVKADFFVRDHKSPIAYLSRSTLIKNWLYIDGMEHYVVENCPHKAITRLRPQTLENSNVDPKVRVFEVKSIDWNQVEFTARNAPVPTQLPLLAFRFLPGFTHTNDPNYIKLNIQNVPFNADIDKVVEIVKTVCPEAKVIVINQNCYTNKNCGFGFAYVREQAAADFLMANPIPASRGPIHFQVAKIKEKENLQRVPCPQRQGLGTISTPLPLPTLANLGPSVQPIDHPPVQTTISNPVQSPVYKIGTLNTQSKFCAMVEEIIKQILRLDLDFCAIQDTGKIPSNFIFNSANLNIISHPPLEMINAVDLL
jgi:hypothetical protein